MRLKAQIWIQAYIRACAAEGCPAMVVRHGDDDAGAIYIKVAHLDGTGQLFGPAPAGLEVQADDRQFTRILEGDAVAEHDIDAHLAQTYQFDPDIWVVEVEDAKKRHFLDGWL